MPISPDSDFCLMGAVECLDITADIYHGAFIARLDVDAIIDGHDYRTLGLAIEQSVLQWRQTASVNQQVYMAVHGILGISTQVNEAVTTVINCLTDTQMTTSTLPIPWMERTMRRFRIEPNDSYPESIDRLLAYWKIDRWCWKLGDQYRRTRDVLGHLTMPEIDGCIAQLVVQYGANAGDVRPKSQSRRERRRVRRVINRGIKSFDHYFGRRDIQAFISDRKVTITGGQYDYVLTNHGNIVAHSVNMTGGTPFGLDICDKAGDKLASACIYLPKTPILDQILALALNVKDPESEIEFLQRANLHYTHPNIRLAGVQRPMPVITVPTAAEAEAESETGIMTKYGGSGWYQERDRVRQQMTQKHRVYVEECIRELSGIPAISFEAIRLRQDQFVDEVRYDRPRENTALILQYASGDDEGIAADS